MRSKSYRILVTGGSGFIGSHLVDELVSRGHNVSIIDNLSTGNVKNINKNARFYSTDITDKNSLEKIFKDEHPNYVFHLAANTNVPLSVKDPRFDFKSLEGSINIISLSCDYKINRLIYSSSGFIYGNTSKLPISENEPFQPVSPYAITKISSEYYIRYYHQTKGLPYLIFRFATVYGPRQEKGAMADYISKLSANKQAEIYGDGSKTRDYIYIKDVVDVFTKMFDLKIITEMPIFNIGTAKETSLKELYFTIAKLLRKSPQPIYKPQRAGELEKYCLSYKKINRLTSWKPKFNISQGLTETLRYRGLIK